MGGKGGATNPEQLFAGGYAACFKSAVIHVTRNKATNVKNNDIVVVAEVACRQMAAVVRAFSGA
jgi:lipoyl-dependent peroxiredoxin